MFPRSEPSIDKVIADLAAVLADVPPYSPEALKLAEVIRRLRGQEDSGTRQPRY
jgi:hypothetical protein